MSPARIRLARPGDGQPVAALAALALNGNAPHPSGRGDLVAGINTHGGRLAVPWGHATVTVTENDDATLTGMALTAPPVAWINTHTHLTHRARAHMGRRIAQLELLAVAEQARRAGTGTALLNHVEARLHRNGARMLAVKIQRGHYTTMRWYRQRGYRILPQGQPVQINVAGITTTLNDGNDGYQLALKTLTAHTPPPAP